MTSCKHSRLRFLKDFLRCEFSKGSVICKHFILLRAIISEFERNLGNAFHSNAVVSIRIGQLRLVPVRLAAECEPQRDLAAGELLDRVL